MRRCLIVISLLWVLLCSPAFGQIFNLDTQIQGTKWPGWGGTDTGAANAYAVTVTLRPILRTGSVIIFKAVNANSGASTLAINGGTAKAIKKGGSTALTSGDISANQVITVVYDGTNFQCQTCGSSTGGSSTIFQVNGVGLTSSSTVNFQDSAAFNGLTATFSNPSAGNVKLGFSGTLGNAGLTNSSTTVLGSTCTLGSTCSPTSSLTANVSGILPLANGGTGTGSTLTGLIRGNASAFTAAELSGDVTTSGSNATTVAKVDGVSYPTDTSTNTVPVKTSAGAVSYAQVPNAALANPSMTVNGQPCTLGSSCTVSGGGSPTTICDPTQFVCMYDDFVQVPTSSVDGTLFNFGGAGIAWRLGAASTTQSQGSTDSGTYGYAVLTTSTSSGQVGNLTGFSSGTGALGPYNATTFDSKYRAKVSVASSVSWFVGFTGNGNSGEAATAYFGIAFDTNQSDTGWMCVSKTGGTATRSAVTGTLDTNYHTFRIRSTVAGTIKCSIDGGTETSISTNVPTANMSPQFSVATRSNNARAIAVDYFWHWYAITR